MSHVETVKLNILDLECLTLAMAQLGGSYDQERSEYSWWGHHVGDYPVPEGFTISDMGHAEHGVLTTGDSGAYEVGVYKNRDGSDGYCVMYDFYGSGGRALEQMIGKGAGKLKQAYAEQVLRKTAKAKGMTVIERESQDGQRRLTLTTATHSTVMSEPVFGKGKVY